MEKLMRRPGWFTTFLVGVGLWLMLSPLVLGFVHPAAWSNALAIGAAVVVLGLVRHLSPRHFHRIRWMVLVVGGWLFASPFVVGYVQVDTALYNALAAGMALIVAIIVEVATPRHRPRAM